MLELSILHVEESKYFYQELRKIGGQCWGYMTFIFWASKKNILGDVRSLQNSVGG